MSASRPIPAIIPAYRAPELLARCIEHLAAQTRATVPLVIDNNVENRLYTRAINLGLKQSLAGDAPYYLLLNQDMMLRPTAVAEMVRTLESDPRIGIVMPLHLDPENPSHVTCGGTEAAFPLGQHYMGALEAFTADRELPWANGAAMLLRKEMVQEIGLLDESMRFICSDVDYSFSARARGWKVWLSAKAHGLHKPGASIADAASPLELVKCDDILAFAAKWLTGDLYRRLASEGPALTPDLVAQKIGQIRGLREGIARKLGPS
jgi:hypothetical protein